MLDQAELATLLRRGNPNISDRELRGLFAEVDTDGSGKINFDEFIDFIFDLPTKKAGTDLPDDYQQLSLPADVGRAVTNVRNSLTEPPTPKPERIQMCGASFHPDINGIFIRKMLAHVNGRPLYERLSPPCSVFYGWTQGRRRVGWFIAKQPPAHGDVKRYKVFNPSPLADRPEMCCATWETPGGNRDKRMFCEALDSEDEDELEKPLVISNPDAELDAELFEARGGNIGSVLRRTNSEARVDEDADWEQEWEEQVGEDVEDFEADAEFAYEFEWADMSGKHAFDAIDEGEDVFLDIDFPPGEESLGAVLDAGMDMNDPLCLAHGFVRLPSLHDSPCLFHHVAPDDIVCGTSLRDAWFLSACAAVAEYPAWVQSMFGQTTELQKDGKYGVRLYHPGRRCFSRIVIDDFVPAKGLTKKLYFPSFAGITMDGEIWVALVEKAFAKLCGSYLKAGAGKSVAFGMLYLCGGGGSESWTQIGRGRWNRSYSQWQGQDEEINELDRVKVEEIVPDRLSIDADELWNLLWNFMELCYPTACSIDKESNSMPQGLLSDRSYSLVGVHEVTVEHRKLRLLFLRNPFGVSEWEGRWSDSSSAWSDFPSIAARVHFRPKKDGTFWMSYKDFLKYFSVIDVVKKSMPVQGCHRVKLSCLKRRLESEPTMIGMGDFDIGDFDDDDCGYMGTDNDDDCGYHPQ